MFLLYILVPQSAMNMEAMLDMPKYVENRFIFMKHHSAYSLSWVVG